MQTSIDVATSGEKSSFAAYPECQLAGGKLPLELDFGLWDKTAIGASRVQQRIRACTSDFEFAGYLGWHNAIVLEFAHSRRVDLRPAPVVRAGRLHPGDALQQPLAAELGFKLAEHAQHVEK